MPLYEYECDAQQHRFEVILKFSDPPVTVCPTCGSSVHKLISAPAFQLKGTGWYVTDYAKKDGGAEAKSTAAENKDKASDASKSGEKTDGAAKTEAAPKTEASPKADSAPKSESAPKAAAPAPASSKPTT